MQTKDHNLLYNNFNLLRLFAALQVVFVHAIHHLKIENSIVLSIQSFISYFPGVPIFFLISGYLITMSYEKNQNIYEYAKNRFLRIIPGLYVSFFVGLMILFYFNQFANVSISEVLLWCLAQLTFFQFYNPDFIRDFGVGVLNGSLWTISIELSFYICLPFIYVFLKRNFYKKLLFLLTVSFIFSYYVQNISSNILMYEKLVKVSILPYLFYFLFGLVVYKNIDMLKKYIVDKFYIYLALYALVIYFSFDSFVYTFFKQVVFTLFIFSAVFSYRTLSYKLLKHNDFTYGIYIYHMLVVNIFVEVGYMGEVKNILLVLVLSILFGIMSYILVEKPFLNMKRKSLYNEINK